MEKKKKSTHPAHNLHSRPTALLLRILRPLEWVLGDGIRESTIRPPAERPSSKNQLVRADTERPPVNVASVPSFSQNPKQGNDQSGREGSVAIHTLAPCRPLNQPLP